MSTSGNKSRRAVHPDCASCAYRQKTQSEALELLRNIVKVAHLRSVNGGTLMEAKLTHEEVVRLCMWEAGCEDCEASQDLENEMWPEATDVDPDDLPASESARKRKAR